MLSKSSINTEFFLAPFMMLDFNQSSAEEFWLQLQAQQKSLRKFASLSITQSQTEKDQFLADCHTFISKINWDSIGGGCYTVERNSSVFLTEHNAILASFLLAAGQTFYDGELIYLGERILQAIERFLFSKNHPLVADKLKFSFTGTPFIFKGRELEEILELQEKKLLTSLLNVNHFESESFYWINYRLNLKKSAKKAKILYKQAQILEQVLRTKLFTLRFNRYQEAKVVNRISISAMSQILSAMVQAILWNKKEEYRVTVREIRKTLVERLNSTTEKLTKKDMVYVCHGLLDYCQIDLDLELLVLIQQNITMYQSQTNDSTKFESQTEIMMAYSMSILEQLKHYLDKSYPKTQHLFSEKNCNTFSQKNDFFRKKALSREKVFSRKVVLLSSDSKLTMENQKLQLLSCYDPELRIYQL